MTVKNVLQIGPWSTTNLVSHPSDLDPSELAATENIVIDVNGSLRPRPAFDNGVVGSPSFGVSPVVLGTFYGITYIAEDRGASGVRIHRFVPATNTWNSSFDFATPCTVQAAVPYLDEIYFVCSDYNSLTKGGFRYNPGLNTTGVVANLPFLPADRAYQRNAFIYKERLWVINGQTINWSKPTDPTDWTIAPGSAGFLKPDAGQDITGVTAYAILNDVMYFFKRDASYSFNFYTAPDVDGQLRKISDTRGALPGSAVSWSNRVFIYDDVSVYEVVNNQFIDIGEKIGFYKNFSATDKYGVGHVSTAKLHLMRDFLIVGPVWPKDLTGTVSTYKFSGESLLDAEGIPIGESYISKNWYVVFNLNTGAWFLWSNICNAIQSLIAGPYFGFYSLDDSQTRYMYVVDPVFNAWQVGIVDLKDLDKYFGDRVDPFTVYSNFDGSSIPPYRFTTKTFDFGSPYTIKKIHKIRYNRSIIALLSTLTNFTLVFKYFLSYNTNDSRIAGLDVDTTRDTGTSISPRGSVPSSQQRLYYMGLGFEFKQNLNENASGSLFNFHISDFEVEYSMKSRGNN